MGSACSMLRRFQLPLVRNFGACARVFLGMCLLVSLASPLAAQDPTGAGIEKGGPRRESAEEGGGHSVPGHPGLSAPIIVLPDGGRRFVVPLSAPRSATGTTWTDTQSLAIDRNTVLTVRCEHTIRCRAGAEEILQHYSLLPQPVWTSDLEIRHPLHLDGNYQDSWCDPTKGRIEGGAACGVTVLVRRNTVSDSHIRAEQRS
jgi:hypothetical protein